MNKALRSQVQEMQLQADVLKKSHKQKQYPSES